MRTWYPKMTSTGLGFNFLLFLVLHFSTVLGQRDTLGLADGFLTFQTKNFDLKLVKDAQILASLKPSGESFDFLAFDYLPMRAGDGQYHLGDITFRYRTGKGTGWVDGNSASLRKPVRAISTEALAASNMEPTLPSNIPLNVTREWIDVSGDLGLRFTLTNSGDGDIEIGSLGFPTECNSIFTNRFAVEIQKKCSLEDPYVGLDAGYLQITPVRGTGPALVITPLGHTPLEAYRNLPEVSYPGSEYGSQTFEGFYEWKVLTKAWAENEWSDVQPWNPPSSKTLKPGESMTVGLRFSLSRGGVRDVATTVQNTGTPFAVGVPGYIVPRDLTAQLFLFSQSDVSTITCEPSSAFSISKTKRGVYTLQPSPLAWGRARLTIKYLNGRVQTVHYYITKPATEAISDLGNFHTTSQWFTDTQDPFGRAPSVISYDREENSIVTQDNRVWIAGLSDEGGAGAFVAAMMKQSVQPEEDEVTKLETFVHSVLWKTIQNRDFSVRKSIFFYEPDAVPEYRYDSNTDWTSWSSWNKTAAYSTDRAYDYVHVTVAYWSLYRVGRAYPGLLKAESWEWYLNQAYQTVMRCMEINDNGDPIVSYSRVGLMGETVIGELLADLKREDKTSEAEFLTAAMRSRAAQWDSEPAPFGRNGLGFDCPGGRVLLEQV